MKLVLFLLVGSLMFSSPHSRADSQIQPPQITVSGSAEIKVVPDEVHLSVGIEVTDDKLEIAKQQSDDRVSSALKFLKASGVADKDIQTDFIGIQPRYAPNSQQMLVIGYVVQRNLGIRIRQVASFDKVFSGLLANGVNVVRGVDFRTSELRKHRDKARSMAVEAAKEKADAMASGLGVKRGRVYSISESSSDGWWNPYGGGYWGGRGGGQMFQNVMQNNAMNAGGGQAEGTLSVGQISVSATVNASFLIE